MSYVNMSKKGIQSKKSQDMPKKQDKITYQKKPKNNFFEEWVSGLFGTQTKITNAKKKKAR